MATDRLRRLPTVVLALLVPVVAVVTMLVTLNATDGSGAAASGGGRGAASNAISIRNFRFSPNPIVVKAGAAVTVTNDDGTVHTLTADDQSFDTGDLDGGAAGTIIVKSPGRYAYHCEIHSYMTGTIEAR